MTPKSSKKPLAISTINRLLLRGKVKIVWHSSFATKTWAIGSLLQDENCKNIQIQTAHAMYLNLVRRLTDSNLGTVPCELVYTETWFHFALDNTIPLVLPNQCLFKSSLVERTTSLIKVNSAAQSKHTSVPLKQLKHTGRRLSLQYFSK